MARDPRYDVLFEPIQIGPKTLRNRFYQVPHCTGFGNDKPWSQARHRGMKAEGGWAAVCTEYCSVSTDADESPFAMARMWDDADVELLRHMADDAHRHGALAGIELFHAGVHSENNESRRPGMGPSQLASDYSGNVAREMDLDDIARLKADWIRAAERSRDAGYDIVYTYGAHTYLLGQFLSPYYNRRSDAYGGSLENRARLWLEVLEAVRAAVGADCAIACRIAVAGAGGAGVDLEEGLGFIRLADDLVDLWDVNIGSIAEWSIDSGVSRFYPAGWQLEWTGKVREATAKPILGVGRLTSPDQMAEIVRSGVWDIIGAARPSIADPFLPQKIDEGRLDDIRECIGCNQCISKGDTRHHLGCTQNATAGEEFRRGWHPEHFDPAANSSEDVLVVGAGPAGLECAIVLAKRGFRRIHLATADDDIGGILRWVPRLPGLGEWGRLLDWRRIQLQKLRRQVEILTATELSPDDVRSYGAELVVVATGSHWAADGLNGFTRGPLPGGDAALPHVLTPEQVMLEGKRPPGRRVVVADYDHYFMGAGMAELLRGEGYEVTLAAANDVVAPLCDETLEGPMLRRHLHELGVRQLAGHVVERVDPAGAAGSGPYDEPFELECDAVVLVTQRLSDDGLWRALKADRGDARAVFAIGDCVAPRLIADAIFDGHRLAREIDSPDPSLPLPYRRERPPVTLAELP
jgi:dimethylamine/trimethylamine dehydrogenase